MLTHIPSIHTAVVAEGAWNSELLNISFLQAAN